MPIIAWNTQRSNGWPIQIENAHYLGYQMRVDATWALDDGSHPILLKALHHLRTANVPEFGQNSILAVAEVLALPETPSLIFATLWNRRGAFVSRTRLHEDFSLWFGGELHADNRTYLLNIVRRRLERLELPVVIEAVQGTGWRLGLPSQEWEPEAFKAADWSFHDVTDIEGDISTLLQNGSAARVVLALSKMRGQPRSLQAIQERHEGETRESW